MAKVSTLSDLDQFKHLKLFKVPTARKIKTAVMLLCNSRSLSNGQCVFNLLKFTQESKGVQPSKRICQLKSIKAARTFHLAEKEVMLQKIRSIRPVKIWH